MAARDFEFPLAALPSHAVLFLPRWSSLLWASSIVFVFAFDADSVRWSRPCYMSSSAVAASGRDVVAMSDFSNADCTQRRRSARRFLARGEPSL